MCWILHRALLWLRITCKSLFSPAEHYIHRTSIGTDYFHHRAGRVTELLREKIASKEKISTETMAEMQLDEVSPVARDILPTLLALTEPWARTNPLYSKLSRWNFQMSKEAAEPTMFHTLVGRLMRVLVQDEVQDNSTVSALLKSYKFTDFFYSLFSQSPALIRLGSDLHNATRWCNDVNTPQLESCSQVISQAIHDLAHIDFQPWGAVHEIQFSHIPFSAHPWLKLLFHRTAPSGGSADTLNSRPFPQGNGFKTSHGPNIRTVMDLGTGKGYWSLDTVRLI